jgi:hypothetical protein
VAHPCQAGGAWGDRASGQRLRNSTAARAASPRFDSVDRGSSGHQVVRPQRHGRRWCSSASSSAPAQQGAKIVACRGVAGSIRAPRNCADRLLARSAGRQRRRDIAVGPTRH